MALKPTTLAGLLILGTLLSTGQASAGPEHGGFGVAAQVVHAHQPALANALPLPLPGHVMQEDARGRHYFYEGTLATARAFYTDEMVRRGYVLVADNADGTQGSALRFQRSHEVTVVQMQGAPDQGLTRINLLAMRD